VAAAVVLVLVVGLVVEEAVVVPLVLFVVMVLCLSFVAVEEAVAAALGTEEVLAEALLLDLVVDHLHHQFLPLQVIVVRISTTTVVAVVVPVVEFLPQEVAVDTDMIIVMVAVEEKVVVLDIDLIL
jgi:hypothetical protein